MASEKLPPHNPWGKGDDIEKTLGPLEMAKVHLRRRIETHTKDHRARSMRDFSEEEADMLDYESVQIPFCKAILESPKGAISESFKVKGNGTLDLDSWVAANMDASLVELSLPFGASDTYEAAKSNLTPDDIRKVATSFAAQYPEIKFEFSEDRQKNIFAYIAHL